MLRRGENEEDEEEQEEEEEEEEAKKFVRQMDRANRIYIKDYSLFSLFSLSLSLPFQSFYPIGKCTKPDMMAFPVSFVVVHSKITSFKMIFSFFFLISFS
jgi:uncharacterized protein (UPF0305 family)